jgi:hypothetical protein
MPFISESSFQKCALRSSKKILCRFLVRKVGSQAFVRTAHTCVSGGSSVFDKKLDFLLRHRYGKTAATVQNSGQHRSDANPHFVIYVQQKCNRSNARATPFGHNPDMVLCEARYGKPVAQLSVRTLSATVWTPPREIRSKFNLGMLSL